MADKLLGICTCLVGGDIIIFPSLFGNGSTYHNTVVRNASMWVNASSLQVSSLDGRTRGLDYFPRGSGFLTQSTVYV